ncbi:hypothetical protein RND71_021056 [Anisodus tanguticus]|uniref:C2H2-type domain-containing protein n=1 Tax=Anisodus tanguticus TaxID=243964 RepID=A0AAE1RWJ5_9SOLA|nr:hypothetical protein RND71_021056 [Anisodus tanguticus]
MTAMKRSREDDGQVEAQAMANCALMLLSRFSNNTSLSSTTDNHHNDFECKTCNKRFPSFQALGGHRASHKRQRLLGDFPVEVKKNKMHKCSICGMEFSSGQALGGHMRRHRDENNKTSTMAVRKMMIPILNKSNSSKRIFCLDLNLIPDENVDLKLWPAAPVASPACDHAIDPANGIGGGAGISFEQAALHHVVCEGCLEFFDQFTFPF